MTDLSAFNLQYFGTDRSDLIWIFDPTFTDIVFVGRFDGPGISAVDVAAVPEPATWAIMFVGFGVLGFALRRERQTGSREKPGTLQRAPSLSLRD